MASTSPPLPQQDRDRAITKLRSQILRTTRKADRSRALVLELDEQSRDLSARSVRWVADEYRRFQETIELRCLVAQTSTVRISSEERRECTELLRSSKVRGKENADVLRGVKELGERIVARTEELGEELVEGRKEVEGLRRIIEGRKAETVSLVRDLAQARGEVQALREARDSRDTQLREAYSELDRFEREQETHDETERVLRLELQLSGEAKRELDETVRTQAAQLKHSYAEHEAVWYELQTTQHLAQDAGAEVEVQRSRAKGAERTAVAAEERLVASEGERLGLVDELEQSRLETRDREGKWEKRVAGLEEEKRAVVGELEWSREATRDMGRVCEKLKVEVRSAVEDAESSRQTIVEVTAENDRLAAELEKARLETQTAECARIEVSTELEESWREMRTVECAQSKLSNELEESRGETHTAESARHKLSTDLDLSRRQTRTAQCARGKLSKDLDRANHTNTTLSSQVKLLLDSNTNLKSANFAQETLNLKLEQEAEATNSTIKTLRKQLTNAQTELTKHQDLAANLQRNLTASEDQCKRMDSTHDLAECRLQELLDTASRERDTVRAAYAAISTELKARQAKLVDAGRATEQLRLDLDISNTKVRKVEGEVKGLEERIRGLAKESVSRAQRISELEPECWELRKRVEKGRLDDEAYRAGAVEVSGKHEKTAAELVEMKCKFDRLESRAGQWIKERDENLSRLGEEKADLLAQLSRETNAKSDAEDVNRKLREQLEESNKDAAEQKLDSESKIAGLASKLEVATQEILDARKDHDKTREELEQASKDLTQSELKISPVATELAVTVIDLEQLRLEYNVFKKKEGEKILDLEAEVVQQKKCVRTEFEKVQNIDKELAVRYKRIFQLQEDNRELRQSKDEAEGLIEVHKKAAVVAFRRVSDELFVAEGERDWYKEDARRWKEEVEAYGPDLGRSREEVRDLRAKMEENSRAWRDWKDMYDKLQIQLGKANKAAGNVKARLEEEKTGLVSKLQIAAQDLLQAQQECRTLDQAKLEASRTHEGLAVRTLAVHSGVVLDLKTKLEGAQKERKDALEQSAKLKGALSLQLIGPQAQIADLRADVVKLGEEKATAESKALQLEADVSAAKETVREQEAKIVQHLMDINTAREETAALKEQHEEELRVTKAGHTKEFAGLEMILDEKRTELESLMSASTHQLHNFQECEKKLAECEKNLTEREKLRAEAVERMGELKEERDLLNADNAELNKRWDENREANSELKAEIEAQCDKAVDNVREEVQCKLDEYDVKFRKLELCAMQLQAERITLLASGGVKVEPTPSRESLGAGEEAWQDNKVKSERTDAQLQETDSGEGNGPPTPAHTLSPGPESPASDISSANGEQKDDEEEPPTPATTWSSDVSSADGDLEDDEPESPTPGQTLSTPLESPESAVSKVKEEYREDEEIGENITVVQRGVRFLTEVYAQTHEEVSAQVHAGLDVQVHAVSRKRKRLQLRCTSQPKCEGKIDNMCDTCRSAKRARLPQGIQTDDAIMGGESATLGSSPCPIIAGSAELINNAVDLAAALFPLDEETTKSTRAAEKSLQDGLHTMVTDSTTNLPLISELVDGSNPAAPTPMTRVLQKVSHSSDRMAKRTPNNRLSRTKTRVTKTSERIFMKP
ncbi:hypothetical protein LTR17_007024 [Elasticomyces elasticus]|nr:hypothetical protein LTR17_007024 [Elasticomyces elasticus]